MNQCLNNSYQTVCIQMRSFVITLINILDGSQVRPKRWNQRKREEKRKGSISISILLSSDNGKSWRRERIEIDSIPLERDGGPLCSTRWNGRINYVTLLIFFILLFLLRVTPDAGRWTRTRRNNGATPETPSRCCPAHHPLALLSSAIFHRVVLLFFHSFLFFFFFSSCSVYRRNIHQQCRRFLYSSVHFLVQFLQPTLVGLESLSSASI